MSIWGRHDSEPSAAEHQGKAAEHQGQAEAHDAQPAAEHQAGEPAPAFWRAQGETQASPGRDPADAPVLTGVVIDGETGVKDPALTGTHAEQAGTHAAVGGPALTEIQEPTVAVAREPDVTGAQEPAGAQAQEPAVAGAQEPAAETGEPAMAETGERAKTVAAQPAAATVTPQRWSEILVAFVDDPCGSVKMAADAVDEAIGEFVNSVRARQRALASSWQGTETGTEQLRTALRDYRKLWHQVQELDLGEKTGA